MTDPRPLPTIDVKVWLALDPDDPESLRVVEVPVQAVDLEATERCLTVHVYLGRPIPDSARPWAAVECLEVPDPVPGGFGAVRPHE